MSQESTIGFDADDEEMVEAIETAKGAFRQFLEAFLAPRNGQHAFLVKVVFVDGEEMEHIWVADLRFEGEGFRGVIANEPTLPTLRFKQQVDFDPSRITDWMYVENGLLVGGYTTRLIRKRMSEAERAALDAAVPYRFEQSAG